MSNYLVTYLPTDPPTHHTYLPPYFLTYLPTYSFFSSLSCLPPFPRRSLNKTLTRRHAARSTRRSCTRTNAAHSTRLDDVDLDFPQQPIDSEMGRHTKPGRRSRAR